MPATIDTALRRGLERAGHISTKPDTPPTAATKTPPSTPSSEDYSDSAPSPDATDPDGTIWTSTTLRCGIVADTATVNQWLFPQLADYTCPHRAQAPPTPTAPPASATGRISRGGLHATTADKHTWRQARHAQRRNQRRNQRRRAWETAEPPPF
ncbi:hypothetical protein ACFFJD_12265 [Gordonia phosphorivorans]|uniref:DUF222 domain-containing protein n=1 Tax=Gordonia phosphorivorans TaxID=1056982 RepID=A0ABV6HAK5_9ACTN